MTRKYTVKELPGGGCCVTFGDAKINYYGWSDVWLTSEKSICLTLANKSGDLLAKNSYDFNFSKEVKSGNQMEFVTDRGICEIKKDAPGADLSLPGCIGKGPKTVIHETGEPPLIKREREKLFFDGLRKLVKG
jgi:hypothetical protein